MTNKKLYSFRFDRDLIGKFDRLANDNNTNRTEYITRLIVQELTKTQGLSDASCHAVGNEPVGHSLQG